MSAKNALTGTQNASYQLDAILQQDFFGKIGLVVGQRRDNLTNYAVYFARTPQPEDAEDQSKDLLMDVGWMQEHVKQVIRMLPGGLKVLGLILINKDTSTPVALSPIKKANVEKVLEYVYEIQEKTTFEASDVHKDSASTFYVVSLGSERSEMVVQALNVETKGWKPSGFKFDNQPVKWQVVKSNFLLDYPTFFEASCDDLAEKFTKTLSKVQTSLENAIILFDNKYKSYARGELLNPAMKKPEKGGKKTKKTKHLEEEGEVGDNLNTVYQADILIDDESDECEEIQTLEAGSRLRLSGKMAVRVYLHPEATVLEAIVAVKEDIMRSIGARLDIHCDSLVGDDTKGTDQPNVPVVHEPPRRCLIAIPDFKRDLDNEEGEVDDDMADFDQGIMVSDFLFPGETPYDSVESVREVFGFYPSIEVMDDDLELVASPQQMVQQVNPNHRAPSDGATAGSAQKEAELLKRQRHRRFNTIAFVLSGVVIIIGILISYFSISVPDGPQHLAEEIAKAFKSDGAKQKAKPDL